jgi:hypothetical protein
VDTPVLAVHGFVDGLIFPGILDHMP